MPGSDDTKCGAKGQTANVTNRNEDVIDVALDSLPYRNSLVMS